ncbi:MAG: nucleotide sugar dehydrogenase [Armatimonadetes bacterium RBG_16_58_9]|nr:MAG: nucleotide sugar dehydrogenase [Armatimonadetes bacterium RBG_16_58_9]
MRYDICVVGGCGHVGLPLAICFAKEGKRVVILDINEDAMAMVSRGEMPFMEEGAGELLKEAVASGNLTVSAAPEVISESAAVVLIMGTPVDAHLNPAFSVIIKAVQKYISYFRDGQLIVLRSTVYPGTSKRIDKLLRDAGLSVDVVFCPERIVEGHAVREIYELPQIVSAFSRRGLNKAKDLFAVFRNDAVELNPTEAELAKLFTNVWRYMKFAIANQFYSIANDHGLDFYEILRAITHNYPRAADIPKAGFAAGPCLFKDTMQLAAYSNNSFFLGHSAMLINEGFPAYVISRLKRRYPLQTMTVGILGIAFKADSDDKRESLAYKLRRMLEIECREVLVTDPYVKDERILPVEEVVARSDMLIVGAPHSVYKGLEVENKTVIDIWNFFGKGALIGQ